MKASAVLETVLYVADLDAAEEFYRAVIGLEVQTREAGRHVFFRCGTGMLLLFNPDATETGSSDAALPVPGHGARGPGHVCFAASAEELDAWSDRLRELGVDIEADFRWPGSGGRSIYIRDPAGNSVEFAEPAIWGL